MKAKKVIQYAGLTVKLFDYMEYPRGKSARNVEAFNTEGKKVWAIEPLVTTTENDVDCWVDILSDGESLIAFNFMGYRCAVDANSGKILASEFTK